MSYLLEIDLQNMDVQPHLQKAVSGSFVLLADHMANCYQKTMCRDDQSIQAAEVLKVGLDESLLLQLYQHTLNLQSKSYITESKEEYIKELWFDSIRQTDIKYKPNIEVRASLS